MTDEEFAAELRPSNIFGALGGNDFEEEDGEVETNGPSHFSSSEVSRTSGGPYTAAGNPDSLAPPTKSGSSTGAAITLFSLVAGGAVGWHLGKAKGALGGALAGGGVRNIYRAQKTLRGSEGIGTGIQQGVVGAAVLGLGGYLLWTAMNK